MYVKSYVHNIYKHNFTVNNMLNEHIYYLLFCIMLIILLIYAYVKTKLGFWALQPVFHVYDFAYMINPPGIIDHSFPSANKYTNFRNIETIVSDELSPLQTQRFVNLIATQYLRNRDNLFTPTKENILPYFNGHSNKSFVTFYNDDTVLMDVKNSKVINDKQLVGIITSRPVYISITKRSSTNRVEDIHLMAYYVDYMCVDKQHRKTGIAQQLIQTHHYNQRHINKKIGVCLFKREAELTGIVPLCVYSTYGFKVDTWTKPPDLSAEYALLEINPQNFHLLFDFIKTAGKKFDILINTDVANIVELIRTANIFVYAVISNDIMLCAYFFRKSCVQVMKNMEALSCFSSICDCDDATFEQGFKLSFWKIAHDHYFGFSVIEDIADNHIIIKNIKNKTSPYIVSPTAYFFYNYAYPTFHSNKTFVLN